MFTVPAAESTEFTVPCAMCGGCCAGAGMFGIAGIPPAAKKSV
jgi:hypothetical protein